MMNLSLSPFKAVREATGLSKADFTRRAAIADSTSTFIEAGLYPSNPPKANLELLKAAEEKAVPVDEILSEYGGTTIDSATLAWQKAVRVEHRLKVVQAWNDSLEHPVEELSPFEDFARKAFGTKDAFCKALKIPVAVAFQFDTGVVKTMPALMEAALMDAGFTQRDIETLEDEQQEWLKPSQVALVD